MVCCCISALAAPYRDIYTIKAYRVSEHWGCLESARASPDSETLEKIWVGLPKGRYGRHLRRCAALLGPAALHMDLSAAFWAPFGDPLDTKIFSLSLLNYYCWTTSTTTSITTTITTDVLLLPLLLLLLLLLLLQ